MSQETIARWQFGITTVYHFFFVPITIALSLMVAVMQTAWYKTRKDKYLKLTKFYGKLFLINFAMGVVTGIVQEFQFGMNWSEYSRFVGDIFGAPLALEALLAFFLESTFLGLWIFGWDRLPKKIHLLSIWLAAIGTMVSAFFILIANSFMQNPVGYEMVGGRAEMVDFAAVLFNPVALITIAHTLTAAYMVAGALVAAIAFWHLARIKSSHSDEQLSAALADENSDLRSYRWGAKFGAWVLIAAGLLTVVTGDIQGKVMTDAQPMKMAAAEAQYETASGKDASFSLFTIGTLDGTEEVWSLRVPYVTAFLATGSLNGTVEGINPLKEKYAAEYGELVEQIRSEYGDEVADRITFAPNIPITYWSFRLMMGLGLISMVGGIIMLAALRKDKLPKASPLLTAAMVLLPLLPLFANSFGWIFTEMGRQPWIVHTLMPTIMGVSPGVPAAVVLATMILFTLVYGILAVVEVKLLLKYIKIGLPEPTPVELHEDDDEPLSFAY
ncbi:cytochrome ubiquinol oxidase subunit I [Enemella sp. A6]|uniref:cytochrome ubiquinol oxidase subunit I n=1 Tax=Enemella sp. A6 TaxID=3440152 RepID=UPI003EBCDA4E